MAKLIQHKQKYFWIVSVIWILALLLIFCFFPQHKDKLQKNIISVNVTPVATQPMPVEITLPGSINPAQSVNVKAQVSGIINKIAFTPGQIVTVGQLLFEIDPAPFLSKLAQVQQTAIKDQALLENAKQNLQRLTPLVQKGYVSKQEYDQAVAQANVETATVQSDKEAIKEAQIQLDYTNITAPLSGKTGDVILKVGDLITAESATPLVTINQLDPVFVNFNLTQKQFHKLLGYKKVNPIAIEVYTESGRKLLGRGKLAFIDNTINTQTGTILLKGLIPNANQMLWPSQMVSVKLILTIEPKALVIPSEAVKVDDTGSFVYAAINHRAQVLRITVNRQLGDLTVVTHGLKLGDKIITVAAPNMQAGDKIKITSASATTMSAKAAA